MLRDSRASVAILEGFIQSESKLEVPGEPGKGNLTSFPGQIRQQAYRGPAGVSG